MFHSKLVGLDLHAPSQYYVENNTGSTIAALKVVALDGLGSVNPQVVVSDGLTRDNFAVVNAPILTGHAGFATSFGILYGVSTQTIDTSAWAPNTHLFCSPTGDLSAIVNGSVVATVVVQHATLGVLLIGAAVAAFGGAGSLTNDWSLTGNIAGAGNFIGTTNAFPINIKTSNSLVAQFDVNGRLGLGAEAPLAHFYQKSGPGYTGSGIRQESLSLTTSNAAFNSIWSFTLANNQMVRITVDVMGRQGNGLARCLFKRTGLFYKQGGNVQIQGPTWISNDTITSSTDFGIEYTMNVTDVGIVVKNAAGIATYWVGKVEYQVLSSNL
jgi:hypothetical protein